MLRGIDVSRHQGIINWPVVKQNVEFAMIKLGGSDQGFYPDGQGLRNALAVRDLKLPHGFYFYLGGAHTIEEEVIHIKNVLSTVGGLRDGEIYALDWEERHSDEVGYLDGIVAGLRRAGLPAPMIYMSLSRVTGNSWQRLVDQGCYLWVAAWGNNDATPQTNEIPGADEWKRWAMWQYSSTGTVPGIQGRVDLNLFAADVADFYAIAGAGFKITTPTNMPGVSGVNTVLTGEYVVQPGDSLSKIAGRFGRTWQELWALNRDLVSQPDRIFPGQRLRVWNTMAQDVVQSPAPTPINPPLPTPTHGTGYHTVQPGENLSVIAAKYNLSNWYELYLPNKGVIGADPDLIKPDQVLRIP